MPDLNSATSKNPRRYLTSIIFSYLTPKMDYFDKYSRCENDACSRHFRLTLLRKSLRREETKQVRALTKVILSSGGTRDTTTKRIFDLERVGCQPGEMTWNDSRLNMVNRSRVSSGERRGVAEIERNSVSKARSRQTR